MNLNACRFQGTLSQPGAVLTPWTVVRSWCARGDSVCLHWC